MFRARDKPAWRPARRPSPERGRDAAKVVFAAGSLLAGAVLCLVAAAFVMWRQRKTRLCCGDTACARPTLDWGSKIALLIAGGLLALTFWIDPPP